MYEKPIGVMECDEAMVFPITPMLQHSRNPIFTMPKKVRIPTPLRKLTNNEELIEINAATIGEAIIELQTRFPGIQERLVDDKGEVRRFVNVYVNEEDIRFLKNRETPLHDGDEISIIPAIAGG
jgi:sulfur-carrier protein